MKVLVTDGENRSALAVTRSLGRKGYEIFVAGLKAGNISASSKFCRKSIITPDPLGDGSGYAKKILEAVVDEMIDIIIPLSEQSIYQLNKVRDRLPGKVILTCARQDKMDAVSNKFELFQLAKKSGIPIPATIFVDGLEDFLNKEPLIPVFPVVVKPAFSRLVTGGIILSTGVMYAADGNELRRLYETRPELRHPSLIQEVIKGDGTGLFTLFDSDRHLVLFSHRRLLEKPPSGGVSVMSESVSLDPEMVSAAGKLLSTIGWKGVAMVEFKRDIRDGVAKLMEINGRFWGSLQLAVSSGVDFPSLCLDYYLGRSPKSLLSAYNVGHKLKWTFGILDHLLIRLKNRDHDLNLPPGAYTRKQVARELLCCRDQNTSLDVYESEDPGPFWSEAKKYVLDLLKGK